MITLHPITFAAFSWNPAINLPEAVALALAFVAGASWLAWKGVAGTRVGIRWPLLTLRGVGLLLLAFCWLNPGHWLEDVHHTRRDWLVLVDRSGSMATEHAPNSSRWQAAIAAAEQLKSASGTKGDVRVQTFAAQLEGEAESLAPLPPDGSATDLGRAISAALDQKSASLAGMVVISDGRETTKGKLDELALQARGRGIPMHVIPLGGSWGSRDLALTAIPRQVIAFRGQPVKLSAQIENRGLGPIKPAVILLGPDGQEIARQNATLTDGARQTVVFDLPTVPESGGGIHAANRALARGASPCQQHGDSPRQCARLEDPRASARRRALLGQQVSRSAAPSANRSGYPHGSSAERGPLLSRGSGRSRAAAFSRDRSSRRRLRRLPAMT